jgi:uncharacterized protein
MMTYWTLSGCRWSSRIYFDPSEIRVGLLAYVRLMIQMDLGFSLVLLILGFIIGFVGGMVGLVLGVVRYPVVMNAEPSLSLTAGTNLGVSTLGAISASIRHYRQGNILFRPFLILASTGAVGAFIGSFLTGYVPAPILLTAIGVIVLFESFSLLKGSRVKNRKQLDNNMNSSSANGIEHYDDILSGKRVNEGNRLIESRKRLIILESAIGFGIGILGGLVGLILGSIRMPAMISILQMEPKIAVGTNLAAASVMGIFGLIGHAISNNIDYPVLIMMGSGAMVGGYLGARYTNRFSQRTLKRMIGLVLVAVAFAMFFQAFELV